MQKKYNIHLKFERKSLMTTPYTWGHWTALSLCFWGFPYNVGLHNSLLEFCNSPSLYKYLIVFLFYWAVFFPRRVENFVSLFAWHWGRRKKTSLVYSIALVNKVLSLVSHRLYHGCCVNNWHIPRLLIKLAVVTGSTSEDEFKSRFSSSWCAGLQSVLENFSLMKLD